MTTPVVPPAAATSCWTLPQPRLPSTLRLVLWPSVVTLAVSLVRLASEVQGWVTTTSGGRGLPLGIVWLAPVFGGWFAWRLVRAGSAPRVRWPILWVALALAAVAAMAAANVVPLVGAPTDDATFVVLRAAVLRIVAVAIAAAAAVACVWPRLVGTLLVYGLIARATVVGITWLAKVRGWDTHYTKFGPMGIECDLGWTLICAAVSQLGFWVPFTALSGTLAGCIVARWRRA